MSNEYQIEIKMEQEQWLLLKKLFNWVITWKLLFSVGGGGGEEGGVGVELTFGGRGFL